MFLSVDSLAAPSHSVTEAVLAPTRSFWSLTAAPVLPPGMGEKAEQEQPAFRRTHFCSQWTELSALAHLAAGKAGSAEQRAASCQVHGTRDVGLVGSQQSPGPSAFPNQLAAHQLCFAKARS